VSRIRGTYLPLMLAICSCVVAIDAQQAPAAVQQAPLAVLKIASGPSGAEANGAYTLTEERSVFSRSTDREVVVFFQWDGLAGAHKLVAQWRSPDGGLTSSSAIDYVAKDRRFGAYWKLTLSPSMPLGTWSIEATVDGQPGGRLTFEIKDEAVTGVAIKRPMTQADIYQRLNGVFVVIERSTSAGRTLDAAGGFASGAKRIYTSLAAIDSTDRVVAIAANGTRSDLTTVSAWHRRQEWAILESPTSPEQSLTLAPAGGLKVGDRIFSIEGGSGGRALIEGGITGQGEVAGVGTRSLATFLNGAGMPGAPVVNEFGELVGMVGGAEMPGATRLLDLLRYRSELKGVPIVPATLMRYRPDAQAETLAALQLRGELIAPLVGEQHVVSGGFARQINRGPVVSPGDQREEFAPQDKTFVTWLNWSPQDRVRGMGSLRIYDAENRVVLESKPAKVDMRKGQLSLSSWTIPVPAVAGRYRVDALIDGKPIWRGFVRIRSGQ
jgi:hypothetical protein